MRMLDADREQGVYRLQLYLSPKEAQDFHRSLGKLLTKPEANDHEHVFAEDMSREISFSILTDAKLAGQGYTPLERRIFDEQ